MKIKFELNTLTLNGTTTQELWFNVYDFGANFGVKRIGAFIHCTNTSVKMPGHKEIDDNTIFGRNPNTAYTMMSLFIPEWADKSRWLFIHKLCRCAEDIEILNLPVSDFVLWLEGKDVSNVTDCEVILDGANTRRSLNLLYGMSKS